MKGRYKRKEGNSSQLTVLQRPVEQKGPRQTRRREAGDELKSLTPHLSSSEEECTHALSGGLLGLEEMSVCALIQAAVPLLMMASTCCFNVTAGSPSIPHWLWLPSAAGSSPFRPPPPSLRLRCRLPPPSAAIFCFSCRYRCPSSIFCLSHESPSTFLPLLQFSWVPSGGFCSIIINNNRIKLSTSVSGILFLERHQLLCHKSIDRRHASHTFCTCSIYKHTKRTHCGAIINLPYRENSTLSACWLL